MWCDPYPSVFRIWSIVSIVLHVYHVMTKYHLHGKLKTLRRYTTFHLIIDNYSFNCYEIYLLQVSKYLNFT